MGRWNPTLAGVHLMNIQGVHIFPVDPSTLQWYCKQDFVIELKNLCGCLSAEMFLDTHWAVYS